MQEENVGSEPGTSHYVSHETPRLLDTPNGWKLVGYGDRELGRAEGVESEPVLAKVSAGLVVGTLYRVNRLYWGHTCGLLHLQGAPIQRIIGPNYAVIRAEKCAPYNPRLHLKNVLLSRIHAAPVETRLEEVVFELGRMFP